MTLTQSRTRRLLVVIVNYRTADLTIDCLRSLEPEVLELGTTSVVVADNASGDGSPELLRRALEEHGWTSWASLLPLGENGGYSSGNNAAIRPALDSTDPPPPDYVLLLNSDTVVRDGALHALLEFMDSHPEVGIAGSRLEDPDGTHQHSCYRFHSVWSELDAGLKLGLVTRLLRNRIVSPPLADASEPHPIDWVAGASMIVRRSVFEDIGLLDPGYFLYFEEVDFCLNARRAGWTCWYVPDSRVMHFVGRSTGITRDPATRRPRYWFASRRRYYRKNHGRLYALSADVAWAAGFALWRVRRIVQRKPDTDPPHMLWDFLRYTLGRGEPAKGLPARPRKSVMSRLLLLAALTFALTFALAESAARVLTRTGDNGMPRIQRFALLPFRPARAPIEACFARESGSTYVVDDPELGWTVAQDGESAGSDGELQYRSNHQGVRTSSEQPYTPEPPPGKVRIVTVGDSFTHCDEVRNSETWQTYLESSRDDLEVLNLGVPAFGTDQALLRWRRDGRRFHAQLVLLGIWPENLCRNLNLMRYYLAPTGGFASKPRMLVRNAGLEVVNSPVMGRAELIATLTEPESSALLAHDFWYRRAETERKPYQGLRALRIADSLRAMLERKRTRARLYSGEDPAGIDITVAIAEQFVRDVREAGSTPLVVLIPMRDLLAMHTAAEPCPLVRSLRARGVEVLDLGPALGRAIAERGVDACYVGQGHHSALGNRLLAESLEQELRPWVEAAKR